MCTDRNACRRMFAFLVFFDCRGSSQISVAMLLQRAADSEMAGGSVNAASE